MPPLSSSRRSTTSTSGRSPLGRAAPLHDVAVQAPDPEIREAPPDLLLDPLRPAAEIADPGRLAVRAAGRDRGCPSAVVTAEARPRLVIDERALALRTGLDMAAIAAQDDRRGAAPVDREDRLVPAVGVKIRHRGHEPLG